MITVSDRAASVLQEGRQVHVAVASTAGPHVTPELYGWSGGRLWFATAAGTVKAKVLARDPSAAVVVSVPGRSVLLAGEVESFDALDPICLLGRCRDLPAAAQALVEFGVRNAGDLAAFGRDALHGRLGWRLPPRRVLFALAPDRAIEVENDAVTGAWGGWASISTTPAADQVRDEPDEVPVGGEAAVLAVPGPIALPARWFSDASAVFVAPDLRPLVPQSEHPAGVVVDDYTAPGPAAKQGALIRGTARWLEDRPGYLEVATDRTAEWDGVEISTVES